MEGGVSVSRLDNYRKQAKQLVRWHRDRNYSVGGRIRRLARYAHVTDRQALALNFPLHEAQEIVALEAGYASWADLKVAAQRDQTPSSVAAPPLRLARAIPIVFVADVAAAATFYRDSLGFSIDFLHGNPPFYGSVSRDGACLHLKFVHEPVFTLGPQDRDGVIMVFIDVQNVKTLFAEYVANSVNFAQRLQKEAWGGHAFIVRDNDGNMICFAGHSAIE
jgi:catechol 2,3-dioxygenase-like lactoylglutathione lyase family enzyme